MANPGTRSLARDWGPAIAVILALISALVIIGGELEQVKQSAADIAVIKVRQDRSDEERRQQRNADTEKLNAIDNKTTRIDTTLTMLLAEQQRGARP
jgi:hypothetical protein